MQISAEGLEQIKLAEGYHTAMKDGRAKSYRCPAGVWTIGWGTTEGVGPGMVWSKAQCEAALTAELDKHQGIVRALVKTPLTQGQFDALVSFNFNTGKLKGSTLLREVNRSRHSAVPTQLLRWTKHKDPKTGGLVESRGLVNRRMREIAMWKGEHLRSEPEPVAEEAALPQAVEPPNRSVVDIAANSATVKATGFGILGWLTLKFQQGVEFVLGVANYVPNFAPIRAMAADVGITTNGVGVAIVGASFVYVLHQRFLDGK